MEKVKNMKKSLIPLLVIVLSLAFFVIEGSEAADISAFALKNGRVCKEDRELECDVNEVPSGIEGPIRYWSAFGHDANDVVTESETGVWFFASDGACLTFVPLESENECQGVVFSPDGGNFVLVTGSGMRPDMYFEVYGEGTEKLAEFSGIRGGIAWIDPVRFVMTSIDDTRELAEEGSSPFGASYYLRVSVVMYDTAEKEATVLKEATDTQNFWLSEIIEDGSALTVTEESVKSEKDWGIEEKTEEREIRVEIPPAG
jgi:hypothetical protein